MMIPPYLQRIPGIPSLYRTATIPWLHGRSLCQGLWHRRLFRAVGSYCQFIGYPRSGHTLVYALLNAHPEVVLSNEMGVLQWMRFGFTRVQLFSMILRSDRMFARAGFTFQGYDYKVPDQWQGRFREIRVIGDKDGGRDTMRLRHSPKLLEDLHRKVGVPLRLVHVVRNPYDTLATFVRRPNRKGEYATLEQAVELGRAALETVDAVIRRSPAEALFTIRHEDVIREPAASLERLCEYLGVTADRKYLDDCARVVFPSARKTRESVAWTPELVHRVKEEMIDRYGFLDGYTYAP